MFSREAQALMEAAVDAIIVFDQRGMIAAVNDAARRMFEYPTDEMLGENVGLLIPDSDSGAHSDFVKACLSTVVIARRKSGASFPALLSVGQIPDSEPPRFVSFVRDTSAQMRREEESRLAQERIGSVARLATLGEMAAGIAHELNQPLTAINTYARACEHFIAMPVPDLAELRDAVREIGAEALRAGTMIRRMRQLVRVDPGEQLLTEADAIIADLKVFIAADARIHSTHVSYQLASAGIRVKADAVQIQQLILNLVRNAFEALALQPPDSREIRIASALRAGQLELSVSDNGPGVSPDIADRLFDPFCTTKTHGTGLGLAISRTIAQSHGGTVGNRPVSPHGACFYVRLPALETATR
jgi:two-component system, LuxR family, sensor kinase FixL